MKDVLYMMILGLAAGMIAGLWTRITKKYMILSFVYECLYAMDYKTGKWIPWPADGVLPPSIQFGIKEA